MKNAEETYLELSERFGWRKISCIVNNEIKTQEQIHEEIYNEVKNLLDS